MKPRVKLNRRKIVTMKELAQFFGVHRHTMRQWIIDYGGVDLHDAFALFNFVLSSGSKPDLDNDPPIV